MRRKKYPQTTIYFRDEAQRETWAKTIRKWKAYCSYFEKDYRDALIELMKVVMSQKRLKQTTLEEVLNELGQE